MRLRRIEAAELLKDDDPLFTLQLSEAQVMDLASGFVPRAVRANCMGCLDLLDGEEDRRRAARPEQKKRKRA